MARVNAMYKYDKGRDAVGDWKAESSQRTATSLAALQQRGGGGGVAAGSTVAAGDS